MALSCFHHNRPVRALIGLLAPLVLSVPAFAQKSPSEPMLPLWKMVPKNPQPPLGPPEGDMFAMDGSGPRRDLDRPTQSYSVLRFVTSLSLLSDVPVLADRSVASLVAPIPEPTSRPENIESLLSQVARALPEGTIWAKVYLPPSGRTGISAVRWNPDAVADFVLLQSELFGSLGKPLPDGSIEIMGRRVSGSDAANISTTLNLRAVYILMNPLRRDIMTQATLSADHSRDRSRQTSPASE